MTKRTIKRTIHDEARILDRELAKLDAQIERAETKLREAQEKRHALLEQASPAVVSLVEQARKLQSEQDSGDLSDAIKAKLRGES